MEAFKSVTTDLDIYRSAKLLIDQHGKKALIEAVIRPDELLDNRSGQAQWYARAKRVSTKVIPDGGSTAPGTVARRPQTTAMSMR